MVSSKRESVVITNRGSILNGVLSILTGRSHCQLQARMARNCILVTNPYPAKGFSRYSRLHTLGYSKLKGARGKKQVFVLSRLHTRIQMSCRLTFMESVRMGRENDRIAIFIVGIIIAVI